MNKDQLRIDVIDFYEKNYGPYSSINFVPCLYEYLKLNAHKYSIEQLEYYCNLLIARTAIDLINDCIKQRKRNDLMKLWTEE